LCLLGGKRRIGIYSELGTLEDNSADLFPSRERGESIGVEGYLNTDGHQAKTEDSLINYELVLLFI
jgi:hypothetical protein